jgi:hypothetical protein
MNPQLLDRARQGVLDGTLPAADNVTSRGGPTSGATCSVCDERIPPKALVIEVTEESNPGRSYCMHVECHAAWRTAALAIQSGGRAADRRNVE